MKPIQDPTLLVGTVIASADDQEEAGTGGLLLNRLVLDSKLVVVYTVASRSQPNEERDVLRLEKPVKPLGMTVLHHRFSVATELYPHHPLLLDPEVRMDRLEQEMLLRAEDSSLQQALPFCQQLKDLALVLLLSEVKERRCLKDFHPSDLFESRSIAGCIDEPLRARAQEILRDLEEDEEAHAALHRIATLIPVGIREQRRLGTYRPNCSNPLCNLLLLFVADFINHEELLAICRRSRIQEHVTPRAVDRFISFCGLIYNLARALRQRMERNLEDGEEEETPELTEDEAPIYFHVLELVQAGSEMAEIFAGRLKPRRNSLLGRIHLLRGFAKSEVRKLYGEAIAELQQALALLTSEDDLDFQQKAHALLAGLLNERNHAEAVRHAKTAHALGLRLGLFEEKDE